MKRASREVEVGRARSVDGQSPVAAGERSPPAWHVERVTPRAMIEYQVAWQNLCDRALEANVFLEPAFALPLIQHALPSARPDFLLVWEEPGRTSFGTLIGLLPIYPPSWLTPSIVRGFADDQIRLGTPLVDRDLGAAALDAMLTWLTRAMPGAGALRLTALDGGGRFCALLAHVCEATGRTSRRLEEHRRAVLLYEPARAANVLPFIPQKKRKEFGRQRRRLSERGARTYTSARTADEISRAAERFLALEHDGWKGDRGTALLARPGLATFLRSMTRSMGAEGKCRIDAIEIDGVAVAMGIILTVGRRAHFWKTTFHEAFAPLSPGVQFAFELTQRHLDDCTIELTDSCAVPDHPMIDRLWPDRMHVTDVLIALRPDAPARFRRAWRREQVLRRLRARAKTALGGWRQVIGRR